MAKMTNEQWKFVIDYANELQKFISDKDNCALLWSGHLYSMDDGKFGKTFDEHTTEICLWHSGAKSYIHKTDTFAWTKQQIYDIRFFSKYKTKPIRLKIK